MDNDIRDLLLRWGKWARSGQDQLGFKNNWDTIFSLAPEPDIEARNNGGYLLDDGTASKIDKIIVTLAKSHPMTAKVIKFRYIDNMPIEAIGKGPLALLVHGKGGKSVSKNKVRELLSRGEGFIEGALNSDFQ